MSADKGKENGLCFPNDFAGVHSANGSNLPLKIKTAKKPAEGDHSLRPSELSEAEDFQREREEAIFWGWNM